MRRTTILSISISLAFMLFATTGLSFAADKALIEAAMQEGEIVNYTAFARRFLPPLGDLFKKMYNLGDDFKVKFTRKGTGATIQMVEAEYMSGRSNWDTVMQSDISAFLRWIDRGMLLKYQPPNIGNLYKRFTDTLGYRVPGQLWIATLAVHNKRVPEKDWPTRWEDALDPKWKGRVGLSNPATAGPAITFTKFSVDQFGWDFYRKLGRNLPVLTKGNSALEQLLLSGEIDLAVCPNFFSIAERIKKGETNLTLFFPQPSPYYTQWTGINKDAPNPNAAKLWQEYLCSDERQQFIGEKVLKIPTGKKATLGFTTPPLDFYKIDWQWIKANRDDMCKRFIDEIQKGRDEG